MKTQNMYEIDQKLFEELYTLKSYCETQKNCHDCKIKDNCHILSKAWNGNDISSLNIGRVALDRDSKAGEYKYVIFGEEL